MERDFRKGSAPRSREEGFGDRWKTSSSEASGLTAQNWNFHRSANDESAAWTDEKHCLYIENLERSFVKQLHKSMGSYGHRSNYHNSVEQKHKALADNSEAFYGDGKEGTGQNFGDEEKGKLYAKRFKNKSSSASSSRR